MRLKSIEIKGFKSFGDKVTIHFNDGVTGIVGPNGCGKSNVVDAMRWVLGEQKSRMLRSDKMENVLFNGTKSRKQAHLAEVHLSFENSKNILPTEFNEVTISRKLYRSGESEYQLNGVNCRLKDITTLFLDTGIGSDSYAIMELKMIDDILNDKENSRRMLFEEASGVSKYKIRKKETLAKLQDTENDLNRVEDLLFEIDKNMRMLQAQARKTERYYKLRDEYKHSSLDLAWFSLQQFREQLQLQAQHEQVLRDQRNAQDAAILKHEAEIQAIKLQITDKEKLLQGRQQATNTHIAAIRQYENEQRLQNERHSYLTDKEQSLQKQLRDDAEHLDYIQQELQKLSVQLEAARSQLVKTKEEAGQRQQILETNRTTHRQLQEQLALAQNDLQNNQQQAHQLEKQVAVYRIQISSIEQEMNRNEHDREQRSSEYSGFESSLDGLQARCQQLQQDLAKMQQAEQQLQEHIRQLGMNMEQSRQRATDVNRQLDKLTNEYNLTKSLVDNLEGYPDSLKFLKKTTGWTKNAQLLSDVLTVKPEFKAAIENYLEPYLNHYVVNTYAEARAGVDLLSDSGKGRASFFVLEAFEKQKQSEPHMLPDCTDALSIADCDVPFANLVNYLLGQVYICAADDFENALKTHSKKYPGIVLISKSGKYTGSGLSLSGGSLGLFEGKRIGRKRNLEILQKDIQKLEVKAREERDLLIRLQRQEQESRDASQSASIEISKQELIKAERELALLLSQQDQHRKFLELNKNRQYELESKLKESTDLLSDNEPKLEMMLVGVEARQQEVAALQQAYNMANEQLQQQSAAFNQANILYHQDMNRLNGFEKDNDFKNSQVEVLKKRTAENTRQLAEVQVEIKTVLSSTDFSDTTLLDMYEQKEAMEKAVQEAEVAWYQERGKLDETENQIRELRRGKEQTDYLLQQLHEAVGQLRLQENGLTERLSVEFEVNANDIRLREEPPTQTAEELKQLVAEMKQKLDNFGPINPMAIEAYKEIEERHTFIQDQRNDLLQAKDSLLQTIAEIDETARIKFMDAFQLIRDNFVQVFRSLFTEQDTCDLVLTDPANPLESAINIIARPKGKKPLTINQLSGGEKTLTATALLFAIYLFKPAPFCIFDEVDAPLDDHNIDKFNRLIRKFSEQSQFIIVTHNKKTMETTDVIYGVTMVEQGVSRVVPVDFRGLVLN
ncbi:MAG: chromosome segregation protein SMC [Bacteroidia bacterium]